jgi:hypothetical protein
MLGAACTLCRSFSLSVAPFEPTASQRVLSSYRRLLTLAQRLPTPQDRASAAGQIRAAFRAARGEADPELIASLLRTAQDKLSYLRMVTPRQPGEASSATRMAVIDGEVVVLGQRARQAGKAQSAYGAGNMDPDQVRRHESLLQRMRFANRPGGVPKGPFGR